MISRGGNIYARAILWLPFSDLTGGFKCFRREVLETLDLDAIQAAGYAFQIELTYRAHKAGFRIAEVPIIFPDRTRGDSKMSGSIVHEAMFNVVKLRFEV
jgi:dolichol-phosphate mannosyltransferase